MEGSHGSELRSVSQGLPGVPSRGLPGGFHLCRVEALCARAHFSTGFPGLLIKPTNRQFSQELHFAAPTVIAKIMWAH